MNPSVFALRRPVTIMVAVAGIALGCALAVKEMDVDVFPRLDLPVIYVAQPYGGMDPAQMEGLITNYYEYHFLYISGIHHVESRNVQGMALMKLFFHPGTNMAQAMAETINYVNRSQAFMPPGTVSPFVMRFDTGSVPVGYLVLSSETRSLAEIQDLALFRVRPMFASLPGVSAPPPFGGNQRTIVVEVDPERLRAYRLAPDDVVKALAAGNTVSPSGNVPLDDKYPIVPLNSIVRDINDLGTIPLRLGELPAVYLRDIATVRDATDIPVSYALVNGRRAIYLLCTKRADASTLSVVHNVKAALPKMQAVLPDDIHVGFEFDQTPYVTRAVQGLTIEGALGAILTGLMVLVFLRDWRSVLVVVLNIPLALMGALIGLWLTGNSINLMTLGGLALAVGILVDEATVEVENIHTQMAHTSDVARAVRLGNAQTAVPRLLAMLCILAVFIPSFFTEGAARALFVPLSLAVGFSMLTSYLLSSTFVPVTSVWLLRHVPQHEGEYEPGFLGRLRRAYQAVLERLAPYRTALVLGYFVFAGLTLYLVGGQLGREIFPVVDRGEFRLRFHAPAGTRFERTEKYALEVLKTIEAAVGADKVDLTLGYVGSIPSSYPINAVFQWSRGPEEALLRIALKHDSGIQVEQLKEQLRKQLHDRLPQLQLSFEPADIVNEVMSFGSPTPVEVAVNGPNLSESRAFSETLYRELAKISSLRDLHVAQSLDYPTINVHLDREKAGISKLTTADMARSLVAATSSSRFVVAAAREQIRQALAAVSAANVIWLPSIRGGVNYDRHDGSIQAVEGNQFNTSRSAVYGGLGSGVFGAGAPLVPGVYANFNLADAFFQPLAARQFTQAKRGAAAAVTNDTLLSVAQTYLELLRSHQDYEIAQGIAEQTQRLAQLTADYAQTGEGLQSDADRLHVELTIRKNEVFRAEGARQVAATRLAQLLHLDPTLDLQPVEPVVVQIKMVSDQRDVRELVAEGLTSRPELSESRSLVAQAVALMRRERFAPLVPSVLLGTSYGAMGSGISPSMAPAVGRLDFDAVAYWELRNMGLGDRAARQNAGSVLRQAQLRQVAIMDLVAREITEALALSRTARKQIDIAREGVEAALQSYQRNVARIEEGKGLPIEVMQAVQALAIARREYLRTLIDYNLAQFSLYRAIGWSTRRMS